MIALLSKSELILPIKVKNPVIVLLLLVFGICFEVSYSNKKVSGSHYNSVMCYTPENSDFPLSIPFSTDGEFSGIEDDFWEDDESFIKLSIISVFLSESIGFHYQNNSLLLELLNRPFTPPESPPVRQAGVTLVRA